MRLSEFPPKWQQHLRAKQQAIRDAVELFVEGCVAGDPEKVGDGIERMEATGSIEAGFRRVARLEQIPMELRVRFLASWMTVGDAIRSGVNNDLILIAGLRVLLPPYAGAATTLYRGESGYNRARRTYGLSWTTEPEVADQWAQRDLVRSSERGSVVLRTEAPSEAILCAVIDHHDDRYGEAEYLVDRRRLSTVAVLRRYPSPHA